MDDLIETIRAAMIDGATDEARTKGASACRAILAALEAKPGAPMAAPVPPSATPAQVVGLVQALRGVCTDQLLELAIAKLRSMVPTDQQNPVRGIQIPIVPVRR